MESEKKRRDLEKLALEKFRAIAGMYPFPTYTGQGAKNRFAWKGNSYFQFGDLRVDMPGRHIIIEVESAGGITNLVKYWYGGEAGEITKPMTLLHIFAQVSADDYASHLLLWDHVSDKMRAALGGRLTVSRYTYRSLNELDVIAREFEQLLKTNGT